MSIEVVLDYNSLILFSEGLRVYLSAVCLILN